MSLIILRLAYTHSTIHQNKLADGLKTISIQLLKVVSKNDSYHAWLIWINREGFAKYNPSKLECIDIGFVAKQPLI